MNKLIFIFSLMITGISFGQAISGKIVHAQNQNQGIPFAKVYFTDIGTTVISDSTGLFSLDKVQIGLNRIEVSALGFESQTLDVNFYLDSVAIIPIIPSHRELDKVIVSTNGLLQRESITNVESHELSALNKIPTTTLGDALSNIPGVYQSSSGRGINKPVIRGLSGSRIVTYVNGLRIENQQWGPDHGLPITSLGIGSIEVIKGPSSLLYGSDAIGGVLYFIDEHYASQNSFDSYVKSGFETNTMGTSNEIGIRLSKNSIHLNAYGGYSNHADYQLPNKKFAGNSRFNQYAGKIAFGYTRKKWVMNIRYNYNANHFGIAGESEDSIPNLADFQISTQSRSTSYPVQSVSNHFLLIDNKIFLNKHSLILQTGLTSNNLIESEDENIEEINMLLTNMTYNFRWNYGINEKLTLTTGSQGMFQINKNALTAEEQLIPDAQTMDAGAFSLLQFKQNKWRFQLGGRYDFRSISTTAIFNDITDFSRSFSGINYSAGFARIGQKSTIRFNVSSGYRSPNTSEMLSDGVHHGSFRYEKGNINLKTEHAVQADFSYGLHLDHLEILLNPFYTQIRDYIYLEKSDTLVDNFNVYNYTQAEYAQLFGLDFGIHYHPHIFHGLHIESSFSTVFAENQNREPIPMIPQSRINTQLIYEFDSDRKFIITEILCQYLYNFKQNRLGVLETETAAYHLINIGLNSKWKWESGGAMTISAGIKNILNASYFDHLSSYKNIGLMNPGINYYLGLKIDLGSQFRP